MTSEWTLVRLELARCPEFPEGSKAHVYLLRLPLARDGVIDESALEREPQLATVHRVWPGEPDLSGYLVRKPGGWAFSYALGDEDDENIFHLETHALAPGGYVTIQEADGRRFPFRIAQSIPDGAGIL